METQVRATVDMTARPVFRLLATVAFTIAVWWLVSGTSALVDRVAGLATGDPASLNVLDQLNYWEQVAGTGPVLFLFALVFAAPLLVPFGSWAAWRVDCGRWRVPPSWRQALRLLVAIQATAAAMWCAYFLLAVLMVADGWHGTWREMLVTLSVPALLTAWNLAGVGAWRQMLASVPASAGRLLPLL